MATALAAVPTDSIGPYRRIRQLGSGGMGEVYLAHDFELGRDLAIKILPPHLTTGEYLSRLRNEARTASSLNHPNIVTIYEIGDDDGRTFMAMEFVDGQTLRDLLGNGPLPVRKALQIATQIAEGLAAAHKRGLVHRDLKPENVMITNEGVVKIVDFGLAKSTQQSNDTHRSLHSDPGLVVGTFAYMSPEQARAGEIDYRSDQFAFGAIVYEMLTGKRAFDSLTALETLMMVARDEPPALSQIAPHVPAPVRWIVDRCLSKDPEERYVSTRDLSRDLQYLRDHFSETGIAPLAKEKESVAERAKKMWILPILLFAGLAIGAGVMAWLRKPVPRVITSERYLTYSGNDYSPAVSADGKLIAFSSNRDGVQRIWLKQVSGGSEVALTPGTDDFPRFSPDGSEVLYVHADPGRTTAGIYRIPVVGGEPRRVVEQGGTADWSPDGKQIAITRNVNTANTPISSLLLVANADGSGIRELAKTDTIGLAHPRWSPDGKWIAAVETPGRVAQAVSIIDVKSGAVHRLTAPAKAGEISSPVWTRDSKAVIYVRAESVEAVVGSSAQIIRHDIKKDVPEVIGWTSHNGIMLDVLGPGRLVVDVRSPRDNLREIAVGGNDTDQRWISRGNSSDRQPVYSPDGKSILFTSNRSGNLDLWLVSRDGGSVKRITDDTSEDWDPAFSPDGKKIIWSSGRSGKLEIWIANADGTDALQVSHDGVDAENPAMTPDGQWIIYNSFNTKKPGIWKVRPDGTQAQVLVPLRASIPEISPDGQYVGYLANYRSARAALQVSRISDGSDTGFLIPIRGIRRTSAILGRMRWMPDGKSIAFIGQNDEGVNGVFVQDFVPGRNTEATRRPLGGFDRERATESFGISRDGKMMTIAGWEQLFSLFSIEGVPDIAPRRSERKENG